MLPGSDRQHWLDQAVVALWRSESIDPKSGCDLDAATAEVAKQLERDGPDGIDCVAVARLLVEEASKT